MLLSKTTAYCPGKMSLAETTFLPRTSLPVASTTAKPPLATAAPASPPATAGAAAGDPGWMPRACAAPAPMIAQAARATMRDVLLEPCADMVLISISDLLAPAGRQGPRDRAIPDRASRSLRVGGATTLPPYPRARRTQAARRGVREGGSAVESVARSRHSGAATE